MGKKKAAAGPSRSRARAAPAPAPPESPPDAALATMDAPAPRAPVAPASVSAGDTTKFEADVDAAFAGRQNGAALATAVKNAGAALQAEQAASGFSDIQAIRIYDDLVELSRTLGAGTPWA